MMMRSISFTLWRHKWLIIAVTILATIIAALFAFITIKPSYHASATIAAPNVYQVTGLNLGATPITLQPEQISFTEESLMPLSTQDVFELLSNVAQSPKVQQDFFAQLQEENRGHSLQGNLSIEADGKSSTLTISAQGPNAKDSYTMTNSYLNYLNAVAADLLLKDRQAELDALKANLSRQLQSLERVLEKERLYQIAALKNSYQTAEKLNLTLPTGNGEDPYLLGTEILAAKIAFLEKQKDQYGDNQRHNELTAKIDALQAFTLPEADNLEVYTLSQSAALPTVPLPTKKKLIIIIGFLLAGMLGAAIVLLREAIRNYKARKVAEV
ncbi:hypothetical protein GCM10007161_16770 [Ignatzschineria indica]|uniref:Polysaccharide chain length determinant N-terminal domain-containing protein n=1 Tax=Ignatzschineria indica TaxID=472583 RepID=A0A2U2AJ17_9GAMM|nr:Wzz/FepE/Etk N-terminal domain-containing protein [Ignatzschineria indica]PWD82637.1 hypothetical protein DC082_08405 [Ignatzschineria indica]GGZ85493.1 hypothetical protein GCM10007161_16770 [Ignatzschineria indica]